MQLRPIAVKKLAYTIVGGKFRENKTVSLKKPVYSVPFALILGVWYKFANENSVRLWFLLYVDLKRFKSSNSENSVQNVIFTGIT